MKKRLKGLYLVISSVIICLLNLPFALAKSASGHKLFYTNPGNRTAAVSTGLVTAKSSVYDSLSLNLKGMSREAFEFAKKGFNKLVQEGRLLNDSIISIID